MPDANLDDIALFFSKNGHTAQCLVPRTVYADPDKRLPIEQFKDYWKKAALLQEGAKGPFVANLRLLDDPGVAPAPEPPPGDDGVAGAPQPGDLVIIPWFDDSNAYVVPKATYEDPNKCPPLSEEINPDLIFMALSEGVVLANVPKLDPSGVTCFILNLLALRSYP